MILSGFRRAILIAGGVAVLLAAGSAVILPEGTFAATTPWVLAAIPIALLATQCSARAWASLVPAAVDSHRAVHGFVGAIPAKYLPGAVGQPMGVVGLTARDRTQVRDLSVTFVYSSLLSLLVGVGFGAFALPSPYRWLALGTAAAGILVLATPAWTVLPRWKRLGVSSYRPDRGQVVTAVAWNLAGFSLFGVAAWILLDAAAAGGPMLKVVAAFGLAWSAGFVAIVIPAGAGVREAAFLWVLGSSFPGDALVAMVVQHRVATLFADLLLVAIVRPWNQVLN